MSGVHKNPTISFRISDYERREIEARIKASGMMKKTFFTRCCIYGRICVVGKKETVYMLVQTLEKMQADTDIGKYGRMWLRYMIENKPSEYRHMARMGQLRKQAEAVNEEAYERLDNIEAAWLKKHMTGKRKTFMEQLYLRNQARAMAEEIVINEIVFKCR